MTDLEVTAIERGAERNAKTHYKWPLLRGD